MHTFWRRWLAGQRWCWRERAPGSAGFTYRLKPRASRSKGASNKLWYA